MMNSNAQPNAPEVHELLGDPVAVRGHLALLGWPSLSAWAKAHGYTSNMAVVTVLKWSKPRPSGRRAPHGKLTIAILNDLQATITEGRRPANQDA
jgi:hypothetical protein